METKIVRDQKEVEGGKMISSKEPSAEKNTAEKRKNLFFNKPFFRHIIVGVLILILLTSTTVMSVSLPVKSNLLKNLRNAKVESEYQNTAQTSDLQIPANKEKIDKLNSLFPDEAGIVNFVREIEKLKADGTITSFSFVNTNAVRDKTGNFGIPYIVEMKGTWSEINANIQALDSLKHLTRAVTIEAEVDDSGVVDFKYGGFIYVSNTLGKIR